MEKLPRIAEINIELDFPKRDYSHNYREGLHGYVAQLCGDDNHYGLTTGNYAYSSIEGLLHIQGGVVADPDKKQYFTIRTDKPTILSNITRNLDKKKELFGGIKIKKATLSQANYKKSIFTTRHLSPILLPNKWDNIKGRLTNEQMLKAEVCLTNGVRRRMQEYGLPDDPTLKISILRQDRHNVFIKYRQHKSQGRNLTLKITGRDETKHFILTHGIGRSTGIGLGFLD